MDNDGDRTDISVPFLPLREPGVRTTPACREWVSGMGPWAAHTCAALVILGGARVQVFRFASVLAASHLAGSVCTRSSDFLCDSSFPPEVRKRSPGD